MLRCSFESLVLGTQGRQELRHAVVAHSIARHFEKAGQDLFSRLTKELLLFIYKSFYRRDVELSAFNVQY